MDLLIKETGDGGDFVRSKNDFKMIDGFQNMAYLAMFGGNTQASTPTQRIESQQAFDWWGNNLLMPNDQGLQFNSETERVLNKTPLNSSGRLLIEDAVRNDLKFMKEFGTVAVAVSIISDNRVAIGVQVGEPDNVQKREFIFLWDATLKELETVTDENSTVSVASGNGFDYILDFVLL